MIKKINWFNILGLVYTIAVGVFLIVWSDYNFEVARIQSYLFDFGVDTIGALFCVALFYGCLRQKGEGTLIFRLLILMVSTSFLINELMLFVSGLSELRILHLTLCVLSSFLDLALIVDLYYYYVKKLLSIEGKIAKITDIIVPILASLGTLIILINIIYPLTFAVDEQGVFSYTSLAWLMDIAPDIVFIIGIVHIIICHAPWNQKIPALLFVIFPGIGYYLVGGEHGAAAQYGFVLMSLIVMYCVIFNDNSKKMTATETELNMGTEIQANTLPSVFPPFPDRHEFDIYASMTPAKEVGGDFYDFFMIDDDHLALVIADVSGKGIPAALFMMSSKILINDHALIGGKPSEILERVNKAVYANNKAHMFVTVWLGILEISTGKLITSSAGHEYPIINIHGKYELFKDRHGLAIGAMPNSKYVDTEIQLKSGDQIFVYTDGVAEATNFNKQMFGTERTVKALNSIPKGSSQKDVLEVVRKAVDEFVKEAPQFDDLTMIGLRYIGPTSKDGSNDAKNVEELVVKADRNNLDEVQAFIDEKLEAVDCPIKTQTTIDIAVEEIFVNIASYAYENNDGDATIQVSMNNNPLSIEITFIDSGTEYNPLAKPDPNTSLKLMERKKGGLGIFMVKKSMDDMTYEYKDGKNILKIVKNL